MLNSNALENLSAKNTTFGSLQYPNLVRNKNLSWKLIGRIVKVWLLYQFQESSEANASHHRRWQRGNSYSPRSQHSHEPKTTTNNFWEQPSLRGIPSVSFHSGRLWSSFLRRFIMPSKNVLNIHYVQSLKPQLFTTLSKQLLNLLPFLDLILTLWLLFRRF